ncbi:DUF4231 domain-containing protein [Phaeobacter inhibens]|uniref:DUF4231 domain-containing protein n=1 Tax=Phaeobacter inhibens TaxID=221822 RepID=UPI0021A769CF|nr:DUF4231 domain-containing protein [Phaeobacter inhibens]UWR63460.1 DUF4231 domain-containing protein [Phaeobacter inhibens]
MSQEPNSGYERLEAQITWYDTKSQHAQKSYKRTKYFTLVATSLIPVLAISELPYGQYVVAVLGALVAIFEGANHVNQWQHNWITYRSTCEALRHEKYTYIEACDPYDHDTDVERRKLLVERVESLISTEHSKWIAVQEEAAKNSEESPRATRSPN